jgi:hypothetical protein
MGRQKLEDLGEDGRIILKEIRCEGVDWNSTGSEYGPMVGSCDHGNEYSSSIKKPGIFGLSEHLSDSQESYCDMEV